MGHDVPSTLNTPISIGRNWKRALQMEHQRIRYGFDYCVSAPVILYTQIGSEAHSANFSNKRPFGSSPRNFGKSWSATPHCFIREN